MPLPITTHGLELEYPARLFPFPGRLGHIVPGWLGHIPFAFWLVETLRPRMLVELGVHTGNSYCAFLQAVQALGLETRCYGIDHWKGDEHAGFYDESVYQALRSYHDPLYSAYSTLIRSCFDDALAHFSDGSIDLLHIDGFHTYEAVSHDFSNWLPKMSPTGIVLLHDINVREHGFGIWRFWEELSSRFPTFDFVHSHGLGVAYVGKNPLAGQLERLFCSKDRARIRSYFARLGASIEERFALRQNEARISMLQREIKQRNETTLYVEVARREATIATLEQELGRTKVDRDRVIALLRQQTMQVLRLQSQLLEKQQKSTNRRIFHRLCHRIVTWVGYLPPAIKKHVPPTIRLWIRARALGGG